MTDAISLTINGRTVEIDVHPTTPLLDVLRNSLGLTGTRFGCGEELCGACMVLIDGTPEYSCSRDIGTVAARAVVTIEGLGTPDAPHPVQQAILDEQAGQCGYCLSGMMIAASALLKSNPSPTRDQIVEALDRHLCRCGSHLRIIRAVQRAADLGRAGART